MKPSYEELLETIKLLSDANYRLMEENKRLQKRVVELENRLNLNSKNSSKPPSTDQKKNKQAPKGGAKRGHPGHFRKLFPEEQVSKRVTSSLHHCPHCGSHNLDKKNPYILQQVELPEIEPIITQIECEKGRCRQCGKSVKAPFPKEYAQSSFGPRLITFIGMCSSVYRLSKRPIQQLLEMMFKVNISLGSIPAQEKKLSKGLEPVYKSLKDQVDKAKVAYVDETSFRQQAKMYYVWTATTKNAVYLKVLPSRSISSLNHIRPRGHPGITVTDRYQVYAYKKHQYCLAHIKRDFKRFADQKTDDQELAERALFELQEIFLACRLSCRETMQQRVYYRKGRLNEILIDILANGSDAFSRFAERMLDQIHKLFLFTKYREVDCTNNAAERSLRHIVLWRKTSYGTQSESGSRFIERAVSLWMTLKKQGKEVAPFFLQAYKATYHPWVAAPVL
ncbi:MAG: IS66 family transposase [Simkaniaceae bacterium]|nr:MAG: IS66 family transposase [Simkaniaceae bacterium]QVL55223.1 MAG: IS66 family transposase [Simkaniaceae bacterium]QVL55608.1 MAG: IS66 family transposase [Simkaniaceae bacterium]QVL55648.1 MAG: IS66 family transposase [Simkaniaceae bacterium]QVL56335.1 MAG: IS66 family transposase [Simkaniaceae bacterium]